MEPLVSVCIPTYNNPKGLVRTLECITRQTYKNLEIIVSDNCSQDPHVEQIAWVFFETDGRLRYWKQPYNMGVDENYRFTSEQATGDYFMFAQDDDWWSEGFIENLVFELEKHRNSPVAICPSRYEIEGGDFSNLIEMKHISPFWAVGNGELGFACMGLWRKEMFKKSEVRFPTIHPIKRGLFSWLDRTVLGGDHITVAHALLAFGDVVVVPSERYIKGYTAGRFNVCFRNDNLYSFRTWYFLMKTLVWSPHIPISRKMLLPFVAVTNFMRACAITATQIVVSLPEGNPIRKIVQKRFFGAN